MTSLTAWFSKLFSSKPKPMSCPYCKGTDWYEGPSGGVSTNIMCANPECEHWFNYHQGIIPMDDLHMVGRDRR